jgi:uncharacterized DUF497 family protein
MDIEFDAAKDSINQGKHNVPLAVGRLVIENAVADVADPRDYVTGFGVEERRIAYGLISGRLFVCAYTMRGATCRLISVRKANERERRKWLR